jgi:hypothetical protein
MLTVQKQQSTKRLSDSKEAFGRERGVDFAHLTHSRRCIWLSIYSIYRMRLGESRTPIIQQYPGFRFFQDVCNQALCSYLAMSFPLSSGMILREAYSSKRNPRLSFGG